MCVNLLLLKMQNRFHSAPINIMVEPEDKEFLQQYCAKKNKSVTMVLRDYIKSLKYGAKDDN